MQVCMYVCSERKEKNKDANVTKRVSVMNIKANKKMWRKRE